MSHRFNISYGLDISDCHAAVVRSTGRGRSETIATASSSAIPESIRRQIAAETDSGRASSSVAMACHETVMRRLSAPMSDRNRALRVLPSLLDVQLPFPLEQCAFAFTGLETTRDRDTTALAIAARHEDVRHVVARCNAAGADPMVLDHEGLSLWELACDEAPDWAKNGGVLLHLGPAHFTLIYGRGEHLLGAHSSRTSGTDSPSGEIAARIQTWLQAQTSLQVTQQTAWFISGAGAADTKRVAELKSLLGASAAQIASEPAAFLARALAARAWGDTSSACNLRIGGLEHPQHRLRTSSQSRRNGLSAVAAAILLIAVNAAALFAMSHRNDLLQQQIQKLAQEISGAAAPKGQEVLIVRRSLQDKESAMRPFQRMITADTSRGLNDLLSLCRTNGAAVSLLSLQPASLKVEMTSSSSTAADRISTALRFSGWQIQQQRRDSSIAIEGTR